MRTQGVSNCGLSNTSTRTRAGSFEPAHCAVAPAGRGSGLHDRASSAGRLEQVAIHIEEVHAARSAELVVGPAVARIVGAVAERDLLCSEPFDDQCEA